MKNKLQLFNKKFADKFVREHYSDLNLKFRVLNKKLGKKGYSLLDKLNDIIIILYDLDKEFENYEEFESYAFSLIKSNEKTVNQYDRGELSSFDSI